MSIKLFLLFYILLDLFFKRETFRFNWRIRIRSILTPTSLLFLYLFYLVLPYRRPKEKIYKPESGALRLVVRLFSLLSVFFHDSRTTNHGLCVFLFPLLFFLYFSYLACLSCLCAFFSRFRFFCPFSLLFFLYFFYLASLLASLLPCYSFYTSSTSLLFLYQLLPCLSLPCYSFYSTPTSLLFLYLFYLVFLGVRIQILKKLS